MKYFFTILCVLFISRGILAQAGTYPATLPENNCGTGQPLASGANINNGDVFSYCATSSAVTTFSGINLSGGSINICGNATITSGNWNSGNIIVNCGSTLTFNGNLTLNNNIRIVNYGRVNINGTLNFQNNGNSFYNETANSSLYVSGDIIWPQNSGDHSYLKNLGYVSVGGTINARNGVYVSSGGGSIMAAASLVYGTNCGGAPADRFQYTGPSGTSILRLTGASTLYGHFTNSASYAVNLGTGATVNTSCSGATWGSAQVASNSPSYTVPVSPAPCAAPNTAGCYTALPVGLVNFEAVADEDKVQLYWATESEHNNDYFTVQRSADGLVWENLANVESQGEGYKLRHYQQTDELPLRGVSYYRLRQTDYDGAQAFSDIRTVVIRSSASLTVYPNPAQEYVILLPHDRLSLEEITLLDATGRTAFFTRVSLSKGEPFTIALHDLPKGVYFVFVTLSDGTSEVRQVAVSN